MERSTGAKVGLLVGGLGMLIGLGTPLVILWRQQRAAMPPPEASRPLEVSLDPSGPYVILATSRAASEYADAIQEARRLHPAAAVETFDPGDLGPVRVRLRELAPRYAMIFLRPDELDVNLAWAWLRLATELDADPFVDVRTGFITGETPADVLGLMKRITSAVRGGTHLPAQFVDNLGPNPQAPEGSFFEQSGSCMIPVLGRRMAVTTLNHGSRGLGADRLARMGGAGVLHYGGHGYPDRVVDSLNGVFVRRVPFSPCVFFNGACYTGVTGTWFEEVRGLWRRRAVDPSVSFSLGVLKGQAVAYLAALHPDHGIPVYQEMETAAFTGASLGDVMKSTHDGVVLAWGGRLGELPLLADGATVSRGTPAEIMLKGTAARVLFGDPAMRMMAAFTPPPFRVQGERNPGGGLAIEAVLENVDLKSTFTETYFSDLSRTGQFNDRVLVNCPLPGGTRAIRSIEELSVVAGGRELSPRLVGFGLERDGDALRLHVLADLPSTAYQEGPLRQKGARIRFKVRM